VEMMPLDVLELDESPETIERLWLRGGFPESYLARDDRASLAWRRDFIRTYLERDIPLFGPRIPAETMGRLWTMLAHRQGGILNASDLARSLDISAQSVTRYIDLLADLLLVRRLEPFFANIGKRLVKSPKIYVRDSGLVHALLDIDAWERLIANPVLGTSWEGFIIEQVLSVISWPTRASFYRTQAGAEIDLLLEFSNDERWAIEIKHSSAPRVGRGFHIAREDLSPTRSYVVHAGTDRYPLAEGIEAVSVHHLLNDITTRET